MKPFIKEEGLVAPYDKATQQYERGLDGDGMPLPPSRDFPLGTDSLGRDVLIGILSGIAYAF